MHTSTASIRMLTKMEADDCCIACRVATQKGARRKVAESLEVLSLWEEASRKVLDESSHHRLSVPLHERFMCRKCFNAIHQNQERSRGMLYTLSNW